MSYNILTYDNLSLHSSEVINIRLDSNFKIVNQGTVNFKEITQPGNTSPIEIDIKSKINREAHNRMKLWRDKPLSKPLFVLNFLGEDWGGYFLSRTSIVTNELDGTGNVIKFSMDIKFIQNISF